MIFKSYLLEENIQTINNHKIFLFYGENEGLKKEFKDKIKAHNKNNEILSFFQEEIVKIKNILINEILNKSLFQQKKIIFIDNANDKVLEILEESLNKINDEKIILFSDILDKRSKLRNYLEKNKSCGIAACYQDNEISIKKIISKRLKSYAGLTNQIVNFIIQNTGLERNKVNNELDKITSYFKDKKIDINKIDLLLNIRSSDDFNLLKDEALNGNKIKTNRLLADTIFEIENNVFYLNSINQRIKRLNEIENEKKENSNVETIVNNLKPPVFWKDKVKLIEQSKKWNKNKKFRKHLNKHILQKLRSNQTHQLGKIC